SRAARHGYTRDHVRSLRVVWDDGTADDVAAGCPGVAASESRTTDIRTGLQAILDKNSDAITAGRPRTEFDRCGYRLYDVAGNSGVDLCRLLPGSEGTLAVTTEATLRTIPIAGGRTTVVLGFPTMEAALSAGLGARELRPA